MAPQTPAMMGSTMTSTMLMVVPFEVSADGQRVSVVGDPRSSARIQSLQYRPGRTAGRLPRGALLPPFAT